MAKDDEVGRTVSVSYRVTAGDVGIVDATFKVYPGTEMVYGQVINAAITKALVEMSIKAAELIGEVGDASKEMQVEAVLGKAVL